MTTHKSFPLLFFRLLLYGWIPEMALACGGFFCQPNAPVVQSGEAIVFAINEEENSVTMHVQILYEGPAEDFSWILPVPSAPVISIGTDALFRGLFQSTLPTFELDIIEEASDTCTLDQAQPIPCPFMNFAESSAGGTSPGSIVVEEGNVGPFEFVVLEAADNDPSSIFRWLVENGYDQPEGADALLNYYASHGQKFVALRLQKDTDTGEIEPIVLTYTMPEGEDEDVLVQPEAALTSQTTRRMALACVPIQLTRIAAANDMPVQVYVLGNARAVPLNYLEVELDDDQVDWVGCINNPPCYDNDYRQRFQAVTNEISNHTFITEYAGSTNILNNSIAMNVSLTDLDQAQTPSEFLSILAAANVPDTRRVTSLIDEFIPPIFSETAPFFCQQLASAYSGPSNGFGLSSAQCLWDYQPGKNWTWNPVGLSQALEENVFLPAAQAQEMVSQYDYLTRLFTSLSPDQMSKDPFFALKPELGPVSNTHRAVAVPECREDGSPIALAILVEGSVNALTVPATIGCNGWIPSEPVPLDPAVSFARQVAAWGFADDEGVLVMRSDNGTFDTDKVQFAIDYGDSLVMNQTIPEYIAVEITARDANDSARERVTDEDIGKEEAPTGKEDSTDPSAARRPSILKVLVTSCVMMAGFKAIACS